MYQWCHSKHTWRWDIESFSPGEVSVLYKGEVNTIFNWEAAWKQNLLFSVWYRLGAGMCDLTKKLVGAIARSMIQSMMFPTLAAPWATGHDENIWNIWAQNMIRVWCYQLVACWAAGHDENIKQLELHASLFNTPHFCCILKTKTWIYAMYSEYYKVLSLRSSSIFVLLST